MNAATPAMAGAGISPGGLPPANAPKIDIDSTASADGAQFRAAMDRQAGGNSGGKIAPVAGDSASLGNAIAGRATQLAGDVKKDQQYVSKLLEQATRTGDSMQLMKAMMALNDYQLRVQTISKTVSKAASSVDSLTKLQ